MQFWILDERNVWFQGAIEAAQRAGHTGKRIFRGEEAGEGIGFIRCHAEPVALRKNHRDFDEMAKRCLMVQDRKQVQFYENKSLQFAEFGEFMPETRRFNEKHGAIAYLDRCQFPLVSKADVGASSVNVRILKSKDEAARHIEKLFGPGVEVKHCAGNARSRQKGYALLQRFIPHDVTWRVNAIGRGRAVFKRYCYPDRPVAQTGNVEPVMAMDEQIESLLEYADRFFQHAGTKWCALDVLRDADQWRILESSLAFPWPSPGRCNEAPIFRTSRRWIEIFDAMFDELAAGAWNA